LTFTGGVTIAEAGTQLPFDIGAKGTLFYHPKDHLKMPDFRSDFKKAVQDCLINPDRPDSHVLETLSGRGTLFEIFRRDEAMRRLDAVLSECSRNLRILKKVLKIAEQNQKTPTKRHYVTERFGMSGVQLLWTDRYVDEDMSFYKLADEYLRWLRAVNGELSNWPTYPDSVQEWFLKNRDKPMEVIKEFQTRARAARQTLSKRF